MNDPESHVSKLIKEFKLGKDNTLLPGEKTAPHLFYIDPLGVLARYKYDHKDQDKKAAEFRDKIV